jgi:hypothetical protein
MLSITTTMSFARTTILFPFTLEVVTLWINPLYHNFALRIVRNYLGQPWESRMFCAH